MYLRDENHGNNKILVSKPGDKRLLCRPGHNFNIGMDVKEMCCEMQTRFIWLFIMSSGRLSKIMVVIFQLCK
jgi:hypothetical protein